MKDRVKTPRIGFLDIETSNLAADFGIILSYCIKPSDSDTIVETVITKEQIDTAKPGQEDKYVVAKLINDMLSFDVLVTYYGTKFDIPFIRTRAVNNGLEFPPYGSILHKDLYYLVRSKFKMSSNRLENAGRVLLGKTQKTRINNTYWRGGVRGDEKSLAYILHHNQKDVLDLEKLYNKVIKYNKGVNASI